MRDDMITDDVHTCLSCGNQHTGLYCNRFGEKVLIPRERTILYLLGQLVNAFTFLESKMWYSLKTIVLHPGKYSHEFSSGKRVMYMKPVALFLVGNLIYFLFPILSTFNTSLQTQMRGLPSSRLFRVESRVNEKMKELDISYSEFNLAYTAKSSSNSKAMLIILVPLFAIGFSILGIRKKKLAADNLIFAFEYAIFTLFLNTILIGYLIYLLNVIVKSFTELNLYFGEILLSSIVAITSIYFLLFGIKRFYGYNWIGTILSTLVLFSYSLACLLFYRWLLFEITFASFHR